MTPAEKKALKKHINDILQAIDEDRVTDYEIRSSWPHTVSVDDGKGGMESRDDIIKLSLKAEAVIGNKELPDHLKDMTLTEADCIPPISITDPKILNAHYNAIPILISFIKSLKGYEDDRDIARDASATLGEWDRARGRADE